MELSRLVCRVLSNDNHKGVYKAIPIKCFVSHRPPSREGGSVGRAKKKKRERSLEGVWVPGKAGLLERKLGYVVLLFVIRWCNRNRTTK